jgi:hypothetical protein
VLVGRRLQDYLTLKGRGDWFTTKHHPSDDECTGFRKIILDNLLHKTSLLLHTCVADTILLARPNFKFSI